MKTFKHALIAAVALTMGFASTGFADVCSAKNGTAFNRDTCRPNETRVLDALDVCQARSGKLALRDGCKKSETTVGDGSLFVRKTTALRIGSSGPIRNGFICSEGVCECDGDADCNEMFESGVCDGKEAECVEDTVPHFCYCGGTVSNPSDGGGGGGYTDPRTLFGGGKNIGGLLVAR